MPAHRPQSGAKQTLSKPPRSKWGTRPSARRQRTAQSPSLRSLPIRDKERRLEKQSLTPSDVQVSEHSSIVQRDPGVKPFVLGLTVSHALAVRDIDEVQRGGCDEILCTGLRPDVISQMRQQPVLLGFVNPDAVGRCSIKICRSPSHVAKRAPVRSYPDAGRSIPTAAHNRSERTRGGRSRRVLANGTPQPQCLDQWLAAPASWRRQLKRPKFLRSPETRRNS